MVRFEEVIDRDVYLSREKLKEFYNTPQGKKELCSWILMGGLLSDITDQSQVIAHNMVVRKLEEIGLLDEEGLEPLVTYLLERESTKYPVDFREEN